MSQKESESQIRHLMQEFPILLDLNLCKDGDVSLRLGSLKLSQSLYQTYHGLCSNLHHFGITYIIASLRLYSWWVVEIFFKQIACSYHYVYFVIIISCCFCWSTHTAVNNCNQVLVATTKKVINAYNTCWLHCWIIFWHYLIWPEMQMLFWCQ